MNMGQVGLVSRLGVIAHGVSALTYNLHLVEKVVIDQRSLHQLLNIIQPGSYDSVSKINFKALDNVALFRPLQYNVC